MVFAFIPFLLAQVVCVDNGDGTWTCSGSGVPGVTTNAQGQATCTNCVNMTPQKCRDIKQSLSYDANQLYSDVTTMRTEVYDLIQYTEDQKSQFQSFTDCPYAFDYVSLNPAPAGLVASLITGSSSTSSTNLDNAASILAGGFNSSPQVVYGFLDSVSVKTFANSSPFSAYCWGVASQWHASYEVAQSVTPIFSKQINDLNSIRSLSDSIMDSTYSILGSVDEITCESCLMSSGDGSSSGVQAGCLECYLVFLRRYQEQFDLLNSQVQSLTNIQASILKQLDNIASYFPSFSNNLQRIDDYLWTDQSNMLANVEAAIIVISNNVDTIQQYYYHTFSNASDISMGVYAGDDDGFYRQMGFSEAYSNVFHYGMGGNEFNENDYIKLDWFRRVELLLAEISGVLSPSVADDAVSDSQYEEIMSSAESLRDLSGDIDSSGDSVKSVGQSLVGLGRSIGGIFNGGSSSMVLIDNWIGGDALVLSPDSIVVQGCRVVFSIIWSVFACVVMWRILVSSWVVLTDIARWFCTWFPKIYGN